MFDSAIPLTVACQAPLAMEFSRQNSGVDCHALLQGDLPDPEIEHRSPTMQADSSLHGLPRKAHFQLEDL